MKTVLVVDDSRTTREYHANILASAGYGVDTAIDGADGLEKLFARSCDLVLTDINMQGMDGLEFIRRIRKNADWDDLPIVILSTESRDSERRKGLVAGANLYLTKPSEPESLLEHIGMLLGEPS
jgi:two-component system chemotaxis response regulator CheY